MTGQIKFDQTSSLVTEALLKAIAEEDRLVLRKKSGQLIRYILKKESILFLALSNVLTILLT